MLVLIACQEELAVLFEIKTSRSNEKKENKKDLRPEKRSQKRR